MTKRACFVSLPLAIADVRTADGFTSTRPGKWDLKRFEPYLGYRYPARDDFRSPVTAFSAARFISEA